MTPEVFLVWYGGGVIGVYDTRDAADRVAAARNLYALRHQVGVRGGVLARVEAWDVQSTPAPEDVL